MAATRRSLLRFAQASLPLLIVGVVLLTLREPLAWWLHGDQIYDQEAIKEWLREAHGSTLPELGRVYLELEKKKKEIKIQNERARLELKPAETPELAKANEEVLYQLSAAEQTHESRLADKREEILVYLKSLGDPPTKMYPDQLPLFPVIYRISVHFAADADAARYASMSWDSELPRQISQYRQLDNIPLYQGVTASVQYRLHAYSEKQFQERQEAERRLRLGGIGIAFALSALIWVFLSQRRERRRELRVSDAERLRLEEELRRQEADQQRREVERQNLELRSQIFANIGIMAGSYAHNIKNLLVRPNDLLRRCLDEELPPPDREHLLREVKQTLATVTDRLQQILQTVRRDPGKVEKVRIDLNQMAREMCETWQELARDKWKLALDADPSFQQPLWIEGDYSHLQQALENLLFNARDATFEMRNHLREQARQQVHGSTGPIAHDPSQRQALIAAAAWKGVVILRTRRHGDRAILEVQDNGIGMTDEVCRRCTETHFSTKRDNALFAGLSAGMGLGLAFVSVILEHHGGSLEIVSQPLQGACFRLSLPVQRA
jgi:signal transduction histidine kinase